MLHWHRSLTRPVSQRQAATNNQGQFAAQPKRGLSLARMLEVKVRPQFARWICLSVRWLLLAVADDQLANTSELWAQVRATCGPRAPAGLTCSGPLQTPFRPASDCLQARFRRVLRAGAGSCGQPLGEQLGPRAPGWLQRTVCNCSAAADEFGFLFAGQKSKVVDRFPSPARLCLCLCF